MLVRTPASECCGLVIGSIELRSPFVLQNIDSLETCQHSQTFVATGHMAQDAGQRGVVGVVGRRCVTRDLAATGPQRKLTTADYASCMTAARMR